MRNQGAVLSEIPRGRAGVPGVRRRRRRLEPLFRVSLPTRWAPPPRAISSRARSRITDRGRLEAPPGASTSRSTCPGDDPVGVALAGANDALWEESEAAKLKARAPSRPGGGGGARGKGRDGGGGGRGGKGVGSRRRTQPASDGHRRGDETRDARETQVGVRGVRGDPRGFENARALEKRRPRAPDRFVADPTDTVRRSLPRNQPPRGRRRRGFSTPDSPDRPARSLPPFTRRYEAEPRGPRASRTSAPGRRREKKGEKLPRRRKRSGSTVPREADRPNRRGLLDAATFVETLKRRTGSRPS